MLNEDTSQNAWTVPLIDVGDGSGDGILIFPEELLAQTGWIVGDTLSLETIGNLLQISKAT